MNDFIKIIKLKLKLFNTRFKISKATNFLFFYGFIFLFLFLIQIIQFKFGEYEKIYLLKIILLPIFTVSSIFPTKNSIEKARIKSFFGIFNQNKVDIFYLYKNYVLTLIFMLYTLIPYSIDFFKTALFCYAVWSFTILMVLIVKLKYKNLSVDLIRLSLCLIPIIFVNTLEIELKIKEFADSINLFFYIISIIIIIFLSTKILKKMENNYLSKSNFSKILLENSLTGYNFLYILRSGKFFSNLLIFYTNFAVFILKQNQKDATLSFLGIFLAVNFVFLYSVLKIEEEKINFIFEKSSIKNLIKLKLKDLTKLFVAFFLLTIPATYYKLGISSIVLFITTIISTEIFNIILIKFSEKINLKTDKKFINLGILLYFSLLFITYISTIKLI